MKIILVRHGTSHPITNEFNEQNRPLTKEGERESKKIGAYLSKFTVKFDEIWVSPYKRAILTAENSCLSINKSEMKILDILKPDAEPEEVIKKILSLSVNISFVCIVSHQPLLGRILGKIFQTSPSSFDILPATLVELHLKKKTDIDKIQSQFLLVKFLQSHHIL